MSLLPMHPVLSNALRHYYSGEQFTKVLAPEIHDLEDFLVNILAQNLVDNKTTLLVCPDDADPAWMAKIMSIYGMSQYCLVWTNHYLQKQKPLERIKSFTLKEQKQFDQDQYRVALNIKDDMAAMLSDYVSHLYKPVLGKYTWKDLLHMHCRMTEKFDQSIAFHQAEEWQEHELTDFLKNVSKSEEQFENKYALLNRINLLNSNLYREDVSVEMLVDEMTVMLEDIREIKELYIFHFENLKSEIKAKIEQEYLAIAELHLKLKKYCSRLKQRSKKKSTTNDVVAALSTNKEFRLIEEIIDDLNEALFNADHFDMSLPSDKTVSWTIEYLEGYIDSVDQTLNENGQSANQKLLTHLRRLSPYNVEDERIQSLEERLNQFIKRLNESYIFHDPVLNNSLNFEKKIALIRDIEDDLCLGIILLETFPEYHAWRKTLLSEEMEEVVLRDLVLDDAPWKAKVRSNIVNQLLSDRYHPFISGIDHQAYQINEHQKEIYHRTLDKIHWTCYDAQNCAKEQLKSQSNFLYQELFKNEDITEVGITEIVLYNKAFFDAFFPIVLTKQKYVQDLMVMTDQMWDVVVGLDVDLEGLKENPSLQLIQTNRIKHNPEQIQHHEYLMTAPKISNVRQLNMTPLMERHKMGHDLARLLLESVKKVSIYRVKNVCVISALQGAIEDLICAPFISNGIKCLHRDTEDVDALTEAILSIDTELYFYYENGMLDDHKCESVAWQNLVLEQIKSAGIQCISIKSVDVYSYRQKLLNSVRQTILAAISSEADIKPKKYVEV